MKHATHTFLEMGVCHNLACLTSIRKRIVSLSSQLSACILIHLLHLDLDYAFHDLKHSRWSGQREHYDGIDLVGSATKFLSFRTSYGVFGFRIGIVFWERGKNACLDVSEVFETWLGDGIFWLKGNMKSAIFPLRLELLKLCLL